MIGYLGGVGFFWHSTVKSVVRKLHLLESDNCLTLAFLSSAEIDKYFTYKEKVLINKILGLAGGISGKQADHQVLIARQFLVGVPSKTGKVLVNRCLNDRFRRLNVAMLATIGMRLYISSGYRSPYYQALIFTRILSENLIRPNKVYTRVASPRISDHCNPLNPAIDVENKFGLPSSHEPSLFDQTIEYKWLSTNARYFYFKQAYIGNEDKIMNEPWHWDYCKGKHRVL